MYSSILIFSLIVVGNLSLCSANIKRNFNLPLNSNKIPDDVYNINIGNAGRDRRPDEYTKRGQSQTGTLTNKFGEDITYTTSQNTGSNREEFLSQQQQQQQQLEQQKQAQRQKPNYAVSQPSMLEQQAANELLLRRSLCLIEQLQEVMSQLIKNQRS